MKEKKQKDKFGKPDLSGEREIPEKPNEPSFVEPNIFPKELPVIESPEKKPYSPPLEIPILPPK